MFKVGDNVRVLVDNADYAEVGKGDIFTVKEVCPDGEDDIVEIEGPEYWWFSFKKIERVENA